MNQNKISLAKKTLQYLEKKKLRDINLKNFLSKTKLPNMNNKIDLILNINDFFDFKLKKSLVNIEKSSPRDMLFEIMMARYDILNEYSCLLYTSPSPRDRTRSRMPSSA